MTSMVYRYRCTFCYVHDTCRASSGTAYYEAVPYCGSCNANVLDFPTLLPLAEYTPIRKDEPAHRTILWEAIRRYVFKCE